MTSPLPPRLRDTKSYLDRIRQDRANLKQLGVGFVGGRFPPARPLGATALYGDVEDDEADDVDQMAAWNTDQAFASVAGQVTLNLTYVPIDGTLLVFWDGTYLHPSEYVLAGQRVTFTDPHIHVGDRLEAAYWYWPSDVPEVEPPVPPVIQFIGATSVHGSASSIALPAAAQPGDLIVLASATYGGTVSTSDSRIVDHVSTLAFSLVAWGYVTASTTNVACAVAPNSSGWASTTLAVYRGVHVDSYATTTSATSSISLPVMTDAYAAIGVLLGWNGVTAGTLGSDSTGAWNPEVSDIHVKAHTRVVDWDDAVSQATPAGNFTLTGDLDHLLATTLKLVTA